jgi:hypothetical protein
MTSRRTLFTLAAGASLAALKPANAAPAPLDKAAVGYQDVPSGGHVCAQCVYFVFYPANGPLPASRCKLVAGPIAPAGWCEVWSPASA